MQGTASDRGASTERWDAIVIGSGLGGLVAAAYLCAAGTRTLVLEAHYVAGGNSQVFRRRLHGRGYEFDVGIHYVGECGPGGLITTILDGVGLAGRVRFRPLDPDGFSTLIFPDLRFRVPVGWDRYRARLLATFPAEADRLGRVVDVLRDVGEIGRRLQCGEMAFRDLAVEDPRCIQFVAWGMRPVTELFRYHGLSARACAVLLGEQGDYAVRPSRTAVALQGGIMDHYMRGAFYPEGGGQVIAARLIEAIAAYGGEVRTNAPVARIRVERGRVAGVQLEKTGASIDAPVVVSNADLKRTVLALAGAEHFRPETVERVRDYRMSLPLFVVYLGLDADLRAADLPNTNYFLWGGYDIEGTYAALEAGVLPPEEFAYVTTATLKDPANFRLAPAGHGNVQIMTVVPREYALWGVATGPTDGDRGYHRDPEYRRRKAAFTERLIALADRVLPGIGAHVDWKEAATPVTQERFTRSTGGTSYGIELACDQIGPLRIGPETDVTGLYLCGASTPAGHGIANVMRSGVSAAGAVLGAPLLAQIRAGAVVGDSRRLPALTDDWDAWCVSRCRG